MRHSDSHSKTVKLASRWAVRLVCAFVFASASACDGSVPPAPQVGSVRSAIIDAAPSPEDGAVVHVGHRDGGAVCSGTAIARRLIVTARHCVLRTSSAGTFPRAADGFRIGIGPDEEHF